MVEITAEVLQTYEEGQLEIQNQREGYLYRGEIEKIEVLGISGEDDFELVIRFKWFAKGRGYPRVKKWVNCENLDYRVSLITASGKSISEGRFVLSTGFISNELLAFFSKGGSSLDPTNVEGLSLK